MQHQAWVLSVDCCSVEGVLDLVDFVHQAFHLIVVEVVESKEHVSLGEAEIQSGFSVGITDIGELLLQQTDLVVEWGGDLDFSGGVDLVEASDVLLLLLRQSGDTVVVGLSGRGDGTGGLGFVVGETLASLEVFLGWDAVVSVVVVRVVVILATGVSVLVAPVTSGSILSGGGSNASNCCSCELSHCCLLCALSGYKNL